MGSVDRCECYSLYIHSLSFFELNMKGEEERVKYNGRAVQKCPEHLEEASCDVFFEDDSKSPNHASSRSNVQKTVIVV